MCGERLSAYNPGPNCFVHSTHAATHAAAPAALVGPRGALGAGPPLGRI